MQPYDYAHRKGVEEISWQRFGELAASLAEKLASSGVNTVVGVAKAGMFPATAVACMLRTDFYPVRITRREQDKVTYRHPVWKVDVSAEVKDRVVAVVDEIADSGETVKLVAERVREKGAARVVTVCLLSHSWADPMPDVVAEVSDALVIFPWDKQAYIDGKWRLSPEYEEALRLQGRQL